MQNEWFFKWHHIGGDRGVEIDGFDGRMIRYGGINFSGTPRNVYWSTIQRYARQKIGQLFDELEIELQKYPQRPGPRRWKNSTSGYLLFHRENPECSSGQGPYSEWKWHQFSTQQDLGVWDGAQPFDIELRIAALRHIYLDLEVAKGRGVMVFRDMLRDKVTLVKANGTVARENIQAQVSAGQIIMFEADLPLEPGDHSCGPYRPAWSRTTLWTIRTS